jgi:indolepyruvate decarboxylase
MVAADVEPVMALPPRHADAGALAECAEEILKRIEAAGAPVVVVDVEIRRYGIEDKIAALARNLNLPLVTTFMGRGLLEHAPDVVAGTYLGAAGDPAITRLVEDADLVLMLGVILSDTNFALSNRAPDPRRTILASSREVQIGFHCFRDMPLADLIEALEARAKPSGSRPPHLPKQHSVYPHGLPADDAPVSPSDIATAINDLFDRHGKMPMTSDIGDCLFTAMEIDNTALAAPGYYAGMGFGVPAGIGVAATGLRPMILVGDGAFQMTGWELGNCRRYRLDPIVVVFNNKSWEMLRVFQPESHFNDLDDWHFSDIAAPIGGVGERVTTRRELAAALDRVVKRRGQFSLIEVMFAARRDIGNAGTLRLRLQIRPRAHGKGLSGRDNRAKLCRFKTSFNESKSNDLRSDCCSTNIVARARNLTSTLPPKADSTRKSSRVRKVPTSSHTF